MATAKCITCAEQLAINEMTCKSKEKNQYVCKPCNAAKSRIHTLVQNNPNFEQWSAIKGEARKEFLAAAKDLMGEDLSKKLGETIMRHIIKSRMTSMKTGGKFEAVDDVKTKMAEKPDALANLLQNAPRVQHPYTREEMIWVAEISMSDIKTVEDRQELKRDLGSYFLYPYNQTTRVFPY